MMLVVGVTTQGKGYTGISEFVFWEVKTEERSTVRICGNDRVVFVFISLLVRGGDLHDSWC